MSVYIDKLFKYKNSKWCHMWADSETELHEFAQLIGLRREWAQFHQGAVNLPHYDLTPTKRTLALEMGAIESNIKQHVMNLMKPKGID